MLPRGMSSLRPVSCLSSIRSSDPIKTTVSVGSMHKSSHVYLMSSTCALTFSCNPNGTIRYSHVCRVEAHVNPVLIAHWRSICEAGPG